MSYARASPAVAASNGKIYAIGGQLLIVMAIMIVMAMAVLMAIVNCDGILSETAVLLAIIL